MLEIRDVSYTYPDGSNALESISIKFPRSHILAILGRSGSGKTTLLKTIGRFLHPRSGEVLLDGKNILEMPRRDFRRCIGIVFQQLYLFPHLTVLENMILAPVNVLAKNRQQAETGAMRTLDKLGIKELAYKYPSQISGGQAQRCAIARSLILEPEYLLLDEPTSALDVDTTGDFGRWLMDLKAKTTFIIVTHDILFAGKIASSGTLLSKGRVEHKGDINGILDKAGYVK